MIHKYSFFFLSLANDVTIFTWTCVFASLAIHLLESQVISPQTISYKLMIYKNGQECLHCPSVFIMSYHKFLLALLAYLVAWELLRIFLSQHSPNLDFEVITMYVLHSLYEVSDPINSTVYIPVLIPCLHLHPPHQ